MASTINPMPAATGATGNPLNPAQNPGGTRQSLRSNTGLKGPDGNRRQPGSPVDGGQRRSNSQKAWAQGTNPITQKPSFPQQQNGVTSHQKSTVSPKLMAKESNTPDSHAHDRLIFLLTGAIGGTAVITTKNGEKFTGIFSSSSFEPSDSAFVLKMVHRPTLQSDLQTNTLSDVTSPFFGSPPEHSMAFDLKEIAHLQVSNVSTAGVAAKEQNGALTGFRTDSDISGNPAIRERNLQRWEPSAADASINVSLEGSGTAGWDQFEANERLFGATTSYDENLYTTRIDRSDPSYKQKEAEAARIAREIESSEADNLHVREERGLAPENDGLDEEEKYSGVRRDDTSYLLSPEPPSKYTPPARRLPAGQSMILATPMDSIAPPVQVTGSDPALEKPFQSKPNSTPDTMQKSLQQPSKSTAASKPVDPIPGPGPTVTIPKRAGAAENATTNVEAEVLGHFRQFANNEKLKVQERRRNQASYDRTIKLNELMKFSKNFKLATPVPKDLVPILAKDPTKQEEIIERAKRQAEEKAAAKAAAQAVAEQKPAARAPPSRQEADTIAPSAPADRQNYSRNRQGYPPGTHHPGQAGRMHQTMHPGRPGTGMLGLRLANNLQQQKGAMGSVPLSLPFHDIRIPPSGPTGSQSGITSPNKVQTPTSAVSTKFNVRAIEFKPNPAANTFTPNVQDVSGSPQSSSRGRSASRTTSPGAFYGSKKPLPVSERPSLSEQFNPIKRMKKESAEQTDRDYAFNGGIPPAYKTPPTWDAHLGNEDRTYMDMFKPPIAVPPISPQNRSTLNPHLPHQHQLPYHAQQGTPSVASTPAPHTPQHLPQQHHGSGQPHFDEHRLQVSASTSQMFPSPRPQHSHVAYPSPMGPHAQLAFGPVPQFYVNQGASQSAHMRQYPGAPQFVSPQNGIAAPVMVQQPSSGPYISVPQALAAPYNPQMQMYSPSPAHAYPQHAAPTPQPHSGYPSPSRGAPMMMHQGSQPGQPPQPIMFMSPTQHAQPVYTPQQPGHIPPVRAGYPQPHFSSSPHQLQHYPPNQHRAPSNAYNQMPPHIPSQPLPAMASGPHPPDAADDVK